MRCFVVTQGHAPRFRVHNVIKKYGWDPTYVCDTKKQRNSLISIGIDRRHITLSNVPKNAGIQGVSLARDFVAKELMPHGEWSIWIDDNVENITGIPFKYSRDRLDFSDPERNKGWRTRFERIISPIDMNRYLQEAIAKAEEHDTIFCGFSTQDNYFFRSIKWQYQGYCRTQFALYKNDGRTWMPYPTMMLEDMYVSVDVVATHGCVIINRHLKPSKPQFEGGGIGSFEKRLPWLQENCEWMMKHYPGLLKWAPPSNQYGTQAEKFHVQFAKRSQNTVDQWRQENGYV